MHHADDFQRAGRGETAIEPMAMDTTDGSAVNGGDVRSFDKYSGFDDFQRAGRGETAIEPMVMGTTDGPAVNGGDVRSFEKYSGFDDFQRVGRGETALTSEFASWPLPPGDSVTQHNFRDTERFVTAAHCASISATPFGRLFVSACASRGTVLILSPKRGKHSR
jgi:hypothetical protein